MVETNLKATRYRRIVTLDIETVPLDPYFTKGALDALTGRIVCIGLLIDDGERIAELAIAEEDEAQILTQFWATIQPTDLIVGHNVHEFDVVFIKQRSWILNIRPSRTIDLRKFYTTDVWDSMQVWSHWGFKKFVSLNTLGVALDCGQKTGQGEDVAQWWAIRDLDSIRQYCLADIRLTHAIFRRLTFQESVCNAKTEAQGAAVAKRAAGVASGRRRPRPNSGVLGTRAAKQAPPGEACGSLATRQRNGT